MKKFVILIAVIFGLILVTAVGTAFACWRPYAFEGGENVTVKCNEEREQLIPEDEGFSETQKLIKETFRSARFSIVYQNEQVKMQCSDENVATYKEVNDVWIEVSDVGEYKKLFFTLEKDKDIQFIRVFATQTDNYDGGTFLVYNDCNCKKLLDYLEEL